MTPGKAGGLFGERLKGADNTVSRLKAADFFLLPPGRGGSSVLEHLLPIFPVYTPFQGEGIIL